MDTLVRMLLALVLLVASLLVAIPSAATQAGATTPPDQPDTIRVLLVGNSLTYANNLPRLLQAIAASQPDGPRIETATYALPGAELGESWKDGHAARALREGDWDVLVLQERGGVIACLGSNRPALECKRSITAHREFTRLAHARGTRVLLYSTWGRMTDRTLNKRRSRERQGEVLRNAYARLARQLGSDGADVEVVAAASLLLAPANGDFDPAPFSDGVHPSVSSSIAIAARLHAAITGHAPVPREVTIDFPLLPANAMVNGDTPMETQPQIAGDAAPLRLAAEVLSPIYARAAGD